MSVEPEAVAAELETDAANDDEGPLASQGGVTLDACARLSRDLSEALDAADAIGGHYRLEVGSPGLERGLYSLRDYRRFRGSLAKLKFSAPFQGHNTLRGRLAGVEEQSIQFRPEDGSAEDGPLQIPFELIRTGQLVIDDVALGLAPNRYTPKASRRRSAAAGRR